MALVEPKLHQGYLYKEGHTIKSWKRRWCVLQGSLLLYFEDEHAAVPLGWVPQ